MTSITPITTPSPLAQRPAFSPLLKKSPLLEITERQLKSERMSASTQSIHPSRIGEVSSKMSSRIERIARSLREEEVLDASSSLKHELSILRS